MPLNQAERKFGQYLEQQKQNSSAKPLAERSIDDLRKSTDVMLQYAGKRASVPCSDICVPACDGYPIPISIFNSHLPKDSPTLIFYPGCAFVFDLSTINKMICSRIALHSGIKVILIQFRLAPENPMPTSIHDAYDATAFIASQGDKIGIIPQKLILGGWCSGAHCATAVANLNRQKNTFNISHQILLSGSYDLTGSCNDFKPFEQEDKTVSRLFISHIAHRFYGLTQSDLTQPIFSPLFETHHTGMPSTTLITGEYDALRSDTEAYYHKLRKSGISVEKIILEGQTHNTIAMRNILSDSPDPAKMIADVARRQSI